MLGLEDHGLTVGSRADLFTVDAECLAETVAQRPRRNVVLKAGRLAGHMLQGRESREKTYFRQMYLRCYRAAEFVASGQRA